MSEYTTTPNLGLYKPTVNADEAAWGDHLNANADILDAAVGVGGGPFLPLSGGAMSGPITLPGTATASLHAVPLQQVVAMTGGPYLLLAGGIMNGNIQLPSLNKIAAADGDVKWTLAHNGFNSTRTDKNITSFNAYPAYFQYLNECANFPGPFSSNWQQYTALYAQGFSGPTASGNTGALSLLMTSNGMSPANAYDIPLSVAVEKWGQSSTWGIVVDNQDFTGRIPQAFAQWCEYNIEGNGYDVPPWDPAYGRPQDANRVNSLFANKRMTQAGWAASQAVTAKSTTQTGGAHASVIVVTAGGTQYTWYCVQSGTTGATQPTFTAPVTFVATIDSGIMAVSSIVSGTLATGMFVALPGTIATIQITGQSSGPAGGAGNYAVTVTGAANIVTATGCYAAPRVTDGTAIWTFGAHYTASVSAGVFFTGSPADTQMDVVLSGSGLTVTGAFVDTTQLTFAAGASAIRIGSNQSIDFTGGSTVATRNQHWMGFSTFVASGALVYNNALGTRFAILEPYGQFAGGAVNVAPAMVIGSGSGSDLIAINTGYDDHALTIGRNRSTFQEVDFVTGAVGCAFLNTNGSGVLQGAYVALSPAGVTSGKGLGLWGTQASAVTAKPAVTGSKGANAALASLLTVLASYGILTDSST